MKILWWRRLLSRLAGKIFYLIFSRNWLLNLYSRYFLSLFFNETIFLRRMNVWQNLRFIWIVISSWTEIAIQFWQKNWSPLCVNLRKIGNWLKNGLLLQGFANFSNYFESVKKIIFQQSLFKTQTSDRITSTILGWSSGKDWNAKTNPGLTVKIKFIVFSNFICFL